MQSPVPAHPSGAGAGPAASGQAEIEREAYVNSIREHRASKNRFFAGPDSPAPLKERAALPLLEYYPVDPSWRLELPLVRYANPETLVLISSTGERSPVTRLGRIELDHDGARVTLQVYRALDSEREETSVWIPFIDAGSGRETYPAGRYVDADLMPDGRVLADFNRAYNPYCAYGWEGYSCPITPRENRIAIAIRAGEKGFHR